jgi:hypothetical protein
MSDSTRPEEMGPVDGADRRCLGPDPVFGRLGTVMRATVHVSSPQR